MNKKCICDTHVLFNVFLPIFLQVYPVESKQEKCQCLFGQFGYSCGRFGIDKRHLDLHTVGSNKTACWKRTLWPEGKSSLEAAFIELTWFVSSRRWIRKGALRAELPTPRKAESYQITDHGPQFWLCHKAFPMVIPVLPFCSLLHQRCTLCHSNRFLVK